MTERPADIAREAKDIYQSLKEFLKAKEPFDRELEFQRKNLRKRYLTLLLLHPYAKESKDVENHLWMQTSYASISSYKERIAIIDRAMKAQPPQASRQRHGIVEHRKLLARFRQFLAEEEKFWIQLVLRMYRYFGLEEAHPALTALGLVDHNSDETPLGRHSFPEEPATSLVPANKSERGSRLAILSKALICLGDIARYRELYKEAGSRRRRGPAAGGPTHRVYDNAQQRYEQARLLVPHEGNPFHQLAILATYRKDTFASVYYYFRALCVRQPYETAADNLTTVLQKALGQWRKSPSKDPVPSFKEKVVVLHALFRKKTEKSHDKKVYQDFYTLISDRLLPIDLISNVIVLAQGGLWKYRMIRDPGVASSPAIEWRMLHHLMDMHFALLEIGRDQLKDLPSMDQVDNDLAQRITAVFRRTLPALRIASKWLRANLDYVMGDLEFRAYQEKEKLQNVAVEKKSPEKISAHSVHTIRFWKGYAQFVSALAHSFPASKMPSLAAPLEEDIDVRGFLPLKQMMSEAVTSNTGTGESPHPNEEQLMRISDLLADARALASATNCPLVVRQDVTTFDEGMVEARSSSQVEPNQPLEPIAPRQQQIMDDIRDNKGPKIQHIRDEDAMTEGTSRTDDDVLNAAFRHIGGDVQEDDDDDDIVLYNPRGSVSPVASPMMQQATPITPVRSLNGSGQALQAISSPPPLLNGSKYSPVIGKTPISSPRASLAHATTAQDLLLDVMNIGRKPGAGLVPGIQAPPLLFGSELSHRPSNTQSIWTAGKDEQPLLKFASSSMPGHSQHALNFQTSPRLYSHGLGGSQDLNMNTSIWSPSHQSSLQQGGLPPLGGNAHMNSSFNAHQRIPSVSTTVSHQQHLGYQANLGLGGSTSQLHQQQQSFLHGGAAVSTSLSPLSLPPSQSLEHHPSVYSPGDVRIGQGYGLGSGSFYQQQQQPQPHSSANGFGQGLTYDDPYSSRQGSYQSQPHLHSLQHTQHGALPPSNLWGGTMG